MGINPLWRLSTFLWSLSTQTTLCPTSAKQAPVTRPTYPEPMIEISILRLSANELLSYPASSLCPVEVVEAGNPPTVASPPFSDRTPRAALIARSRCQHPD